MTKLEELKAAWRDACDAAYAAWSDACVSATTDPAWDADAAYADAAYAAYVDAAWDAYEAELKKQGEKKNE